MKRLLVALCVLLVFGGGLGLWFRQQARLPQAMFFFGNVEIRQVSLAFRVDGRIATMLVDEGKIVQPGEILATLEQDLLLQNRNEARAALLAEQARLRMLERGYRAEEVAQAQAAQVASRQTFASADAELKRLVSLRGIGAVSQKEVDNARAEQARALSTMRSADEQYRMLSSGYRAEEIEAQKAALAMAEARDGRAEIQLQDAVLRAPQAGTVLTRAREKGAIVAAGQTVFTLSLSDPVWIRMYVTESQLGKIKPGMSVFVETDSTPGKRWPGKVGFIAPVAEFAPKTVETQDIRTDLVYRVRVQVEDPEHIMRQGMPVTIVLGDEPGKDMGQ